MSNSRSKVCSMAEAIGAHVKPGCTMYFAGMQHGEPSAAIHEIIRQRIGGLTVASALTHMVPLLLGEGLLRKVVVAYLNDLYEKASILAPRARARNAYPELEELSHYALSLGFLAGQMGLPFMTTRSQLGSDFPRRNKNLREVDCPFTGQKLMAVRAITPDVGILHAQRCDPSGNAQRWGSLGMDSMGINACKTVIITTEKIVDPEVIRRDPNRTIIPGFRVSAIVEVPWGAYPVHLAGCYNSDMAAFTPLTYDEKTYEDYMERYVYGVPDRAAMMRRIAEDKSPEYLERLKIQNPAMSEPVPTGY